MVCGIVYYVSVRIANRHIICHNIGLVPLIFLGRELFRHCLNLSPVLFLGQPFRIFDLLVPTLFVISNGISAALFCVDTRANIHL